MPNFLLVALVALQTAVTTRVQDGRDRGQGTLEYVGIVIIAGILVAAVIGGLSNGDAIKTAVTDGIKDVTDAGN